MCKLTTFLWGIVFIPSVCIAQSNNDMVYQKDQPSYSIINNIIYKSYLPKIIQTSVNVGVFEIFGAKQLTAQEVAASLNTQMPVTESLLEVLYAADLLKKEKNTYRLSSTSAAYLTKKSDINQLEEIMKIPTCNTLFDKLANALKGQKTEEKKKETPSASSRWEDRNQLIAMEKRAKAGTTQAVSAFIESIPGFSDCRKMIDFTGSIGYYALAILEKNNQLHAHVYDLPKVCEQAIELEKKDKNFDRITYHGFDLRKNESFGSGYDLFFLSNFLYGYRSKEKMIDFFKTVNRSMVKGGIFVSNHMTSNVTGDSYLSFSIFELMGKLTGRPPHYVDENILKQVLTETGFGEFIIKEPDGTLGNPILLFAAKKLKDI